MANTIEVDEVIQEEIITEIKSAEFKVLKKEDASAILSVLGWRMRVYFDEILTDEQKSKVMNGRYIKVDYIGNIKDVFSIQLQKLTKV